MRLKPKRRDLLIEDADGREVELTPAGDDELVAGVLASSRTVAIAPELQQVPEAATQLVGRHDEIRDGA